MTTDFSLEGRHFRRDWHCPESVGHRALARGLSDLAAMGARPVAAFLSLALPRSVAANQDWVARFFDGLLALAERVGVPLGGGDTAEAPDEHVLIDIVLLGAAATGSALRRGGARPGDRLFCTGALGGAAAELQNLAAAGKPKGPSPDCPNPETDAHPQLFPQPRLAVAQTLRLRGLATAAIDLSDGLSTDLRHLCEASGVAAEVEASHLPVHPLATAAAGGRDRSSALQMALHGGEDYELLFTAPADARMPRRIAGVALTEIGRIVKPGRGKTPMTLITAAGERAELKPGGWEHLR